MVIWLLSFTDKKLFIVTLDSPSYPTPRDYKHFAEFKASILYFVPFKSQAR